ncbi:putative transcriptional regulator [Kitasatospora setae KM-6054]|uniref:Putative transcriptional regulator n=2 Tax=Streptomycetaceae TaxID=2062 RepID=E4NG38_KITSK|nr:putative transcriptional regulator [Kitasatospora setae KM-6054]
MEIQAIGELLLRCRKNAGRSRPEQAKHVETFFGKWFDPERIKRWETGKRIPTSTDFQLIVDAYGISLEEVQAAVAYSRRARRLDQMPDLVEEPEEDEVERRTFISGLALVTGLAAEPWGRLAAALDGGPVDKTTTARLVENTAEMFTAEEHMPARLLAARLSTHLDTITSLLPNAGAHQRELMIAAGEAAALAGWVHWDLGDHRTAMKYYNTAALAGRRAGHGAVNALVLGYTSYGVGPDKARQMLTAAQEQVRGPGYATARAWLCAREAEEAAAVGDQEAAVRALDRAATAFDYANPAGEQAWVAFFGPARLGSMRVAAYAKLRHRELTQAADDTLADLGSADTKMRVAVLGDVASGYLVAGSVDQAVEVGRRALAATLETETTMGKLRLNALADQLPEQREARTFREEIRGALG